MQHSAEVGRRVPLQAGTSRARPTREPVLLPPLLLLLCGGLIKAAESRRSGQRKRRGRKRVTCLAGQGEHPHYCARAAAAGGSRGVAARTGVFAGWPLLSLHMLLLLLHVPGRVQQRLASMTPLNPEEGYDESGGQQQASGWRKLARGAAMGTDADRDTRLHHRRAIGAWAGQPLPTAFGACGDTEAATRRQQSFKPGCSSVWSPEGGVHEAGSGAVTRGRAPEQSGPA